jgi:hypothetical protein
VLKAHRRMKIIHSMSFAKETTVPGKHKGSFLSDWSCTRGRGDRPADFPSSGKTTVPQSCVTRNIRFEDIHGRGQLSAFSRSFRRAAHHGPIEHSRR